MADRVYLNWGVTSDHPGSIIPKGRAERCTTCKQWCVVRNPEGKPQHKVCAEKLAEQEQQ